MRFVWHRVSKDGRTILGTTLAHTIGEARFLLARQQPWPKGSYVTSAASLACPSISAPPPKLCTTCGEREQEDGRSVCGKCHREDQRRYKPKPKRPRGKPTRLPDPARAAARARDQAYRDRKRHEFARAS